MDGLHLREGPGRLQVRSGAQPSFCQQWGLVQTEAGIGQGLGGGGEAKKDCNPAFTPCPASLGLSFTGSAMKWGQARRALTEGCA